MRAEILMPLTHASKLRSHPALSIPYTSKAIDQLIQNAQDILNKEQEALWRLQRLSNEFRGDPGWIPVGDMQADHDILFITQGMPGSQSVPMSRSATLQDTASNEVEMDGVEQNQMTSLPDAAAEAAISLPVEDTEDGIKDELKAEAQPESNDRTTDDTQTNGVDAKEEPTDLQPTTADTLPASDQQTTTAGDSTKVPAEGAEGSTTASAPDISADATQPPTQDATTAESATAPQKQEPQPSAADLNQHEDSTAKSNGTQPPTTTDTTATDQDMPDPIEDTPAAHPMTTRSAARLEAPLPPTPSTSASFPYTPSSPYPTIHPLYALPHLTTTKDFGIPSPEAEETRRLLYAYVQRQEEVVRGVEKLYNGLLRARRRRDEVVEWCDAEGHVGEMSDGEDWVDMERWGLVEELKKGEDVEEEDEAAGKGGKKTRGRKERGG